MSRRISRIAISAQAVFGLILTMAPFSGIGQDGLPALVAMRDIGIFTAPRNGLFCRRGDKVGDIKQGAVLTDYEPITTYCGLFFRSEYFRIPLKTADGKTIVAYVHSTEDDGTPRFHPAKGDGQ